MRFLQSRDDFPLRVALGDEGPVWGLSRWGGAGLRFVPMDDEGFALRGDGRQVRYEGRRRSHRFTILGDTAFEYDCILEREPESNVVSLVMEGAEGFDFFRQPEFVNDPFLKGSYAVYKKETPMGEGTGKLCHIHRPEIIDSRGRRVWGELSIVGDRLLITIPEGWLSEARYPVVVDPTIGTSTVGSQSQWYNEDGELDQLFFDISVGVNRYLMSEVFSGTATAYVYAYSSDYDGRCKPVLYSDSGGIPLSRKSKSEGVFDIAVRSGKAAGWRSTSFESNGGIGPGSYVWFGLFCDRFAPRFDYGAKCYRDFWDGVGNDIPETYPLWRANDYYDFKVSMYFSYSSAQNYVRTLSQGVSLVDGRRVVGAYERGTADGAGVSSGLGWCEGFVRLVVEEVLGALWVKGACGFMRRVVEAVGGLYGLGAGAGYRRGVADKAEAVSVMGGAVKFFRVLFGLGGSVDGAGCFIGRVRAVRDTGGVGDGVGHVGEYLRGLFVEAWALAGAGHSGDYERGIEDVAGAAGVLLRHLFIFLRLMTAAFVRDYVLRRFLRAREEIVLKSAICRELTLK